MGKDYLFKVKTMEDTKDLPKGSGVYVQNEKGEDYVGIWSSMLGSFEVTVPKIKCVRLEEIK